MVAVTSTTLGDYLPLVATGKVREIYELDDHKLLFVTTDRISAFDVIMDNSIDQKGAILTHLSEFWFKLMQKKIPSLPTHFLSTGIPSDLKQRLPSDLGAQLDSRSMVVKRLKVLPIESIVRGYITGSAWTSYQKDGTFVGISLPAGLQESQKFDKPIWTPSTKAEVGGKDENITAQQAADLVGPEIVTQIRDFSLQLYDEASIYAAARGIIVADTKFEFGIDESSTPPLLVLVDEVLTPDSSRFWSAERYEIGRSQESFDKQHLRGNDAFGQLNSPKGKTGVTMPEAIVANTFTRYKEAYETLLGCTWQDK
ncbi:MAG: Bifunctional purine biosynthetic protein ade1 [Ramalina farinacea]|uniref:Phosphoribosylaminoimidazole-succinocarboxamide synthase n=1 Tax=Ramalina farinacea TaxID=258253 RepID=A0AA43QLJ2_9LECA|nr:Bifunctional purine biosynthetic protein ade1 [Ramalina farinacea]